MEVACPRPVQAPARCHSRPPPAVQAPPQSANADGTSRSAQGIPKHMSNPEREDPSSQRPRSLKAEILPEFELKPKLLVKDQSKCGSPKLESKPKVRVEAGSARQSRNLGFQRFCQL